MCVSCSILRMLMLTIFSINDVNDAIVSVSSVFIINCKHISNFVLIADSERANVCLVHIEKTNTFKDKIGHIMPYISS